MAGMEPVARWYHYLPDSRRRALGFLFPLSLVVGMIALFVREFRKGLSEAE